MAVRKLRRRVGAAGESTVAHEGDTVEESAILHEVTCSCKASFPVLSIVKQKGREAFTVESERVEQDDDEFIPTCVQCEECDSYHLVTEVCESGQYPSIPRGHVLWKYDSSDTPDDLEALFDGYEVHPARRAYFMWHFRRGLPGGGINLVSELHPDGEIRGRRLQAAPGGKFTVTPFKTRVYANDEE